MTIRTLFKMSTSGIVCCDYIQRTTSIGIMFHSKSLTFFAVESGAAANYSSSVLTHVSGDPVAGVWHEHNKLVSSTNNDRVFDFMPFWEWKRVLEVYGEWINRNCVTLEK